MDTTLSKEELLTAYNVLRVCSFWHKQNDVEYVHTSLHDCLRSLWYKYTINKGYTVTCDYGIAITSTPPPVDINDFMEYARVGVLDLVTLYTVYKIRNIDAKEAISIHINRMLELALTESNERNRVLMRLMFILPTYEVLRCGNLVMPLKIPDFGVLLYKLSRAKTKEELQDVRVDVMAVYTTIRKYVCSL